MTERTLQNMVIKHLISKGWKYEKISNINELKNNFRKILNKRNAKNLEKLNKFELSDSEFERFLSIIEHNTSFSEYARFFLDDDNQITTDEGEQLYLNIFNKKKWCENNFQVTEEVRNNGKIHDILLLINGLPICNIEMKKPSVSINNAFEQTNVYSSILTSITKFIQLFVISNGNETRYFANNESINKKFVFRYSNFDNTPINDVYRFIDAFLDTCIFSKYISRYIVNKIEQKNLIALRGYQVHGAEAAINHLKNSNKNGYLWHATGSGKTITSFKVAQIVSNELSQFDKVVFLVDRRDLDSQTIKEYNSFLGKHNKIQETKNSRTLLNQLYSSSAKDKLIITTIQKMNRILNSNDKETIDLMTSIKEKNFVFIIDECHRSQFGDMNANIKKMFKKIRYIGFTGTPIFVADKETKLVTNDIFHKNLHKYLMPNAIEDGNVLAFQVVYNNESKKLEERELNKLLKSKNHLKNVAQDIINNFDIRSINRKYSAMVVLQNINTLIEFYTLINTEQKVKSQNNKEWKSLKIGATFSYQDNNYSEENSKHREGLKQIIEDFNKHTNSNESINNVSNYQNRLQSVIKDENVDPKINITLVVDQLLTGFDAKKINSIYIIKNLKKHALIQAISRTNRVFDNSKERGIVISYVPGFKYNTDESIKMYSDSSKVDHVIKRDYKKLLSEASKAYEELTQINVEELLQNPSQNKKKALFYIRSVCNLSDHYRVIRTMSEYNDSKIGFNFNKDELNKMIKYSQVIRDKYKKTDEWKDMIDDKNNPFDSIDMPIHIENIDTIDSEYIRVLLSHALSSYAKGDIKATKDQIQEIKRKIESIDGGELLFKVFDELLKKFNKNNHIDIKQSLREIFDYKEHSFINEYNLTKSDLEEQLYYYKLKERFAIDLIEEWIKKSGKIEGLKFIERDKETNKLKLDIQNHLNLFKDRQEILGD